MPTEARMYCPVCGAICETHRVDNRPRFTCPACGYIHYRHRKLSAGVRVVEDGKLLLIQRGQEPWRGHWHMPAGYVEVDEDPRDTAEREALEETGLNVRVGNLVNAYIYNDDPRGNGIVLLYTAELLGGQIKVNSEATSVKFFSSAEVVQLLLAGKSAADSIAEWVYENERGK